MFLIVVIFASFTFELNNPDNKSGFFYNGRFPLSSQIVHKRVQLLNDNLL